jgi:hypothetical protein
LWSLQHGLDRVAQQRGVVARQRRHDQHRGLVFELFQRGRVVAKALEAAQFAKGLVNLNPLVNGHIHAVDIDGAQAKLGLFVVLAQAVHQVVAGRNALCKRVLAQN